MLIGVLPKLLAPETAMSGAGAAPIVPLTVNGNGLSSGSLLLIVTVPLVGPEMVDWSCTVKVVQAPGARLKDSGCVTLNPVPLTKTPLSDSVAVPVLQMRNV